MSRTLRFSFVGSCRVSLYLHKPLRWRYSNKISSSAEIVISHNRAGGRYDLQQPSRTPAIGVRSTMVRPRVIPRKRGFRGLGSTIVGGSAGSADKSTPVNRYNGFFRAHLRNSKAQVQNSSAVRSARQYHTHGKTYSHEADDGSSSLLNDCSSRQETSQEGTVQSKLQICPACMMMSAGAMGLMVGTNQG